MDFHVFHVNASRLHFGEMTKLGTVLSQHAVLNGAYVREITLCVTFGAPCSGATFRILTRCSKYITISLISGDLVSETTVCVTFGARCRSPPGRLLVLLGPLWPPRSPMGSGTVPAGDRWGRQVW